MAISGDSEAVNDLLGFINENVDSSRGLQKIVFQGWKKTIEEIDSEFLTLLATKTTKL